MLGELSALAFERDVLYFKDETTCEADNLQSKVCEEIDMDYAMAFVGGGIVCALVQILMEKTKLMPGRIMVLLVVTGAVLSFVGVFEPLQEIFGAGISVPLLGFGHILMKGVKEAVDSEGFMGLFTGGFKAAAVGCSAALIFGLLAALIFKPKMKH